MSAARTHKNVALDDFLVSAGAQAPTALDALPKIALTDERFKKIAQQEAQRQAREQGSGNGANPTVYTVYQAFLALHSVCDDAETKDGSGFNKYDVHHGARELAGKPEDQWTYQDQQRAYRMLKKYRKQLNETWGIDYDQITAPVEPQAAPETVELLDEAPPILRRPLVLIGEHAYAVTVLPVRITMTERKQKDGTIVKLDQPVARTAQRLFIVRNDGHVFGEGGTGSDEPLEKLGIEIRLPEDSLPPDRLWQTRGVKAYRAGARPSPADVFARVSSVYGHYLDFRRSLAEQQVMCDFSACLSLMSWFIGAFDVLPYPWPNGEWGSGKTKWATIWALTSLLGMVVTWGGSFAALRDLADIGAALVFDDAENINDPSADPDKRTLLLAGNRRGPKVPLKEPVPGEKSWRTRWVDPFCTRAFTAKRRPIEALETRSTVIPLIKTADETRGNKDPVRIEAWPCSWQDLQNDLWAIALMLLPEARTIWAELDNEAEVVGRNFEIWRAPLAVARLFERHGVAGLEQTIRTVMKGYTKERRETGDDLRRRWSKPSASSLLRRTFGQ